MTNLPPSRPVSTSQAQRWRKINRRTQLTSSLKTRLCGPARSEPCFPAYLPAGFDHILHFALYQMQQHWPRQWQQQSVSGPNADRSIAAAVGCVATEACRYSWCPEAEPRLTLVIPSLFSIARCADKGKRRNMSVHVGNASTDQTLRKQTAALRVCLGMFEGLSRAP